MSGAEAGLAALGEGRVCLREIGAEMAATAFAALQRAGGNQGGGGGQQQAPANQGGGFSGPADDFDDDIPF